MTKFRTVILATMLATLLLLGLATGGTACCHTHRVLPSQTSEDVVGRVMSHSVAVQAKSSEGSFVNIGGGTYVEFLRQPHILTAYHVWEYSVDNNDGCTPICYESDCVCTAEEDLIFADEVEDWALIRLPRELEGSSPAKVDATIQPRGSFTFTVGCPDGMDPLVTHGMISGYGVFSDGMIPVAHYIIDGYAYYGSSGGGVFSQKGKLIGVVVAVDVVVLGGSLGLPLPLENLNIYFVMPLSEIDPLTI